MEDIVCGELYYSNGWCKDITINFWNNTWNTKLVISAYEDETPNSEQQDSYSRFFEYMEDISKLSLRKLKEYLLQIKEDIMIRLGIPDFPKDITQLLDIQQILFLESGTFAIICSTTWDEHGIAIICRETEIEVCPEDMVWFE